MSDRSAPLVQSPAANAVPTTARDRRRELAARLQKKAEQARSFPLSFAQERLWVLDQLDPGNPAYNVPLAIRITGALDLEALQRTLNELIVRHEALRTRFAAADGQPLQVVDPVRLHELSVVDLQHLNRAGREEEAITRAAAEVRKSFRLTEGPLFRVLLLRLGPKDHVLVVVMHHIISDDWSMAVLVREVAQLYGAFQAGRPSPLISLPIQYADYAAWQRRQLQGEKLERLLDYWRPRLHDLPQLDLPVDRPAPPGGRQAGESETLQVPPELADRLRDVARQEGATLYMILLAALQVLLGRYSGQEDFAIGSPTAGRLGKETENLVGIFVNTLVVRADLSGNPTFRQLLRHVREVALEAFQHQELPFERLVEAVNPDRDAGRNPLFQVMFALQSAPWPEVNFAGLVLSVLPLDTGTSKFDLSFTAREDREGLSI